MSHEVGRRHFAAFEAGDAGLLVRALDDDSLSEDDVHRVLWYLKRLDDRQAIQALARTLRESQSVKLRTAAATGLRGRNDPDALESLRAATADPAFQVRAWALDALAASGDANAVDCARRALRDDHRRVRAFAARALGELRDRGAVPLLQRTLGDQERHVAMNAARALQTIGGAEARSALEQGASTANGIVRRHRMRRLARATPQDDAP